MFMFLLHWPLCYVSSSLTTMLCFFFTDHSVMLLHHWPLCYVSSSLTTMLCCFFTDHYVMFLHHWPLCYVASSLTTMLCFFITDHYVMLLHHWPLCYVASSLTTMLCCFFTDHYVMFLHHWPLCYVSSSLTTMLCCFITDHYVMLLHSLTTMLCFFITDHYVMLLHHWPLCYVASSLTTMFPRSSFHVRQRLVVRPALPDLHRPFPREMRSGYCRPTPTPTHDTTTHDAYVTANVTLTHGVWTHLTRHVRACAYVIRPPLPSELHEYDVSRAATTHDVEYDVTTPRRNAPDALQPSCSVPSYATSGSHLQSSRDDAVPFSHAEPRKSSPASHTPWLWTILKPSSHVDATTTPGKPDVKYSLAAGSGDQNNAITYTRGHHHSEMHS